MSADNPRALSGIVQKEFRENYRWAILLLLLLSAATIEMLKQLATTDPRVYSDLDSTAMFNVTLLLTPFIGLWIGLAQVVRENRGDKWGFLTHRPVGRSTLFWGKAVAGILLYTAAVALPWIGSLVWLAMPGHLPMPFDPRMALPGAADLLCGIVYYFAGVLTGMRDARWFASRALGIGVGIVCSIACLSAVRFEWAVAFIAGGLIINGAAARGAFVGGGRYQTQPLITRTATGIAIGTGLFLVCVAVILIVGSFMLDLGGPQPPRYTVDTDGNIVRQRFEEGRIAAIDDRQGRPIEKYKDPEVRDTSMSGVVERSIGISPFQLGVAPNSFRSTRRFFLTLYPGYRENTYEFRWYYVKRVDLIAIYDNKTARRIGWMGPGGFSAGAELPVQHFSQPLLDRNTTRQPLIAFENAVYRLDFGNIRIEKIFTPSAGETVLGAMGTTSDDVSSSVSDVRGRFDGIVTTQRVVIQSQNGNVEMTVPFESRAKEYDEVTIYRALYAPDKSTFIWYSAYRMNASRPTPELVTKYDANHTAVARDELPRANPASSMPWGAVPMFLAIPVTVPAALAKPWRGENGKIDLFGPMSAGQRTTVWLLSSLSSLVSALAIFGIGHRFGFSSGRKSTWAVLGFILGPFGFLFMLALVEWPARERCPACGRMRVVTREHCEHCSKPFSSPQLDGTEVFESL